MVTISSKAGPVGAARCTDSSYTRSRFAALVRTLTTPSVAGGVPDTDRRAATILADILAGCGCRWPLLTQPERVTIDIAFQDAGSCVRAEPTDGFDPTLEILFDAKGSVQGWSSWWTEPAPLLCS